MSGVSLVRQSRKIARGTLHIRSELILQWPDVSARRRHPTEPQYRNASPRSYVRMAFAESLPDHFSHTYHPLCLKVRPLFLAFRRIAQRLLPIMLRAADTELDEWHRGVDWLSPAPNSMPAPRTREAPEPLGADRTPDQDLGSQARRSSKMLTQGQTVEDTSDGHHPSIAPSEIVDEVVIDADHKRAVRYVG